MLMVHSRRLGQGSLANVIASLMEFRNVDSETEWSTSRRDRSRPHSSTHSAGITSMASPYPYPPIPADCEDSLKPSGRASINLPRELTLITSQAPLPLSPCLKLFFML